MKRFALHHLQRWARWVLAAWCCVVLGSALSPWARAHGLDAAARGAMEPVCSSSGPHLLVPSPARALLHEGMAPAAHALDCPLCMPVLAPPLVAGLAVSVGLPPAVATGNPTLSPWVYRAAAALPPRGPPWAASDS